MDKLEEKEDKKRRYALLLILLLFFLAIGILLGSYMESTADKESITQDGGGLRIDPSARSSPQTKDNTSAHGVAIPGWSEFHITAGEETAKVDLYNPIGNKDMYYLAFELRLDNDKVLYTSALVEPGMYIHEIELSQALEKGTYDAILHVQPYRMNEGKTQTNNADIKIKLIVE